MSFGQMLSNISQFLQTGIYNSPSRKLYSLFSDLFSEEKDKIEDNGVDSGLSVDAIIEIRDILDLVIEDAKIAAWKFTLLYPPTNMN